MFRPDDDCLVDTPDAADALGSIKVFDAIEAPGATRKFAPLEGLVANDECGSTEEPILGAIYRKNCALTSSAGVVAPSVNALALFEIMVSALKV